MGKCSVFVVQDTSVEYVRERIQEAWHQGLLKPCESADRIELGIDALIVRVTEGPILLDPSGKKIGPPERDTTASIVVRKLLPGMLQEWYCGKVRPHDPDHKALKRPKVAFL